MADSKRQKIVAVIIDSLKTIKTANGYQTDLGTTVEDWQTDYDEADLPAISVCDTTSEVLPEACDGFLDFYKLNVQIRATFSSGTRAQQARTYVADILKSLKPLKDGFRSGTQKLGEQVDLIREGFVLAEDGFRVAAVAVEIEIIFYTERFNAYQ